MAEPAIPDDFTLMTSDGGFIDHVGPYYRRRRGEGDPSDLYHYGFQSDGRHRNINGVIHGGALFAFADTAMGASAYHFSGGPCATISMNADFIAGARPGAWISAEVTIIRKTRSLAFIRCTLGADDETVLFASGLWKLFAPNIPGHDKRSD